MTRRAFRFGAVAAIVLATAGISATAASAETGAPSSYDAVSCVTTTTCMAVGGTVVARTTDGGAHWAVRTPPPNAFELTDVVCSTVTRCEVTGDTSADAAVIYGTLDGGASWHVQPAALPGGFFLAISCATRAACVATGNQGTTTWTADGGHTWTGQSLATITLVPDVDCTTALECRAVADSGRIGVSGLTLHSVDGGRHWAVSELPNSVPAPEGVACPSPSACVIVGQDVSASGRQLGRIITTTDGGATWQRRRLPDGYTYVSQVDCPSVAVCVAGALGPRGLLGTVDGGQRWAPQGPTSVFFRDVSCPNTTHCTAVGETNAGRGTIYATIDGGHSWHHQGLG